MIEPSVSVPIADAARLAATAAPEPELEPPGLRSSTYGLRVCRPRPLQPLDERVDRKFAHSLRFVLPRMTAPASRSRRAIGRVLFDAHADQRQRASRRLHLVGGVDVVFEQDRDAVQRSARTALGSFAIERLGNGERIGVGLDHAAQRWAAAIDRLDALQVRLDYLARAGLAARLARLQLGDADLFDVDCQSAPSVPVRSSQKDTRKGVHDYGGGSTRGRDVER